MDTTHELAELAISAAILDAVAVPVVVYDRELRFAYANPAFCRSVHKRPEDMIGRHVADVFPEAPERMGRMRERMDLVLAGEASELMELPYNIPTPDGRMKERYWRSTMRPLFGADGKVTHIVQSGEDVTEEVLLRKQRDVISAELEHRVLNSLAMAGSLAMVIGQSTPNVEAFIESFTDRLDAMGRNLTMISDHEWTGLPLRTVIEAELAQVVLAGDARVSLEGPDVMLTMRVARWTALLAHELVKNAVRHGCFSVPGGTLRVMWSLEGQRLSAEWVETGRRIEGPPTRQGFGTQMLSLMPEMKFERTFREDGLSLRFSAESATFTLIEPDSQRAPGDLK